MRHISPLRYPGGKACLTGFLADIIDLNDLRGCNYFEPYAGGAGAALNLLKRRVVSEIYLNDADTRIFSFWLSVLNESDRFVDRVHNVPLTIEEWQRQNAICSKPDGHPQFDVGFAAFFMNRCNRSGVLTGSGPIGGYRQTGKWLIDARFNRDELSERVLTIKRFRDSIHINCEDAIVFLKKLLPRGRGRSRVFAYLDPPYVSNGKRLYLNAYDDSDHKSLSRYMTSQKSLHWLVSYDDSELIREIYEENKVSNIPIRYTLQKKRFAQELIIAPSYLILPHICRVHKKESRLSR